MIDEDKAREEEANQEGAEEKIKRLEAGLEDLTDRLASLMAEYKSFQVRR